MSHAQFGLSSSTATGGCYHSHYSAIITVLTDHAKVANYMLGRGYLIMGETGMNTKQ